MIPRGSRSIIHRTGNIVGRDHLFEERDELGFRRRQCDMPVSNGEKAESLGLEIGERAELMAQSSSANYILPPG